MEPGCTIVTTCMGRLAHLRRSLPGWLSGSTWKVVVVDYSCPDGAAAWASGLGDRVVPVSVEASERDGQRPLFNLNRARDVGSWHVGTEWTAFVDADVLLGEPFFRWASPRMLPGSMLLARRAPGLLVVRSSDYASSGGFDLGRTGYGPEEYELRIRMRLSMGLEPHFAEEGVIPAEHGPADRVRNYARSDVAASAARLEELVRRRFGLSLRAAAAVDPCVGLLLGLQR